MDVRITTIHPIQVARIRHIGAYAEVGPCFERLFRWAAAIAVPTGQVLTLSWDDSEPVPVERLRSHACVELRTEGEPRPGIELGAVGGGRYAVYRLEVPYEGITPAYARLFGEWLPASDEATDGGPCMELYRNAPLDTPAEQLVRSVRAVARVRGRLTAAGRH